MPLDQLARGAAAGGRGRSRRSRRTAQAHARPRRGAQGHRAARGRRRRRRTPRAPDVRRTPNLSEEKRIAAQRIAARRARARRARCATLGLGYLSLDRSTPTLSPGELQRLRLATQIRSNLFGVVYVLDEPSAGLHPADGEALLRALDALKRVRQLALRRRARPGRDAPRRLAGRRRPRRRRARRPGALQRPARRACATCAASHTARYLFADAAPRRARAARRRTGWLELRRHHAQQPARRSTRAFRSAC